jgi:hypothetical protein
LQVARALLCENLNMTQAETTINTDRKDQNAPGDNAMRPGAMHCSREQCYCDALLPGSSYASRVSFPPSPRGPHLGLPGGAPSTMERCHDPCYVPLLQVPIEVVKEVIVERIVEVSALLDVPVCARVSRPCAERDGGAGRCPSIASWSALSRWKSPSSPSESWRSSVLSKRCAHHDAASCCTECLFLKDLETSCVR